MKRDDIISALTHLGEAFLAMDEELQAYVRKACFENAWFTEENYKASINHWGNTLTQTVLTEFVAKYCFTDSPQKVGVIMAGNIPLVGFHDLLCVLLSGNIAIIKPSSNDAVMMKYVVKKLTGIDSNISSRVLVVEQLKDCDAVIATGSNNTFRYFEYYFGDKPNLLRKNRKSIAILTGEESDEDLKNLGTDIFTHYGLGCRNVSLILLPKSMSFTKVLDQIQSFEWVLNHNKYANNYTYYKALFLMNNDIHLDNNFLLSKEELNLNTPLGCIYYSYYDNASKVESFMQTEAENIQCVVGNYFDASYLEFGKAQFPDIQDYADNLDTMSFLNSL